MDWLMLDLMGQPLYTWGLFLGIVVFLLTLDLGVFHRKQRDISIQESLWMSFFYIAISLMFGAWIWYDLGVQSGKEYLTGFIVEKTLALDNIFLISLIFTYFAIPSQYQHRVLFWGILGVIFLRGIMIFAGAAIVQNFSWILYIFALFLVATGVKMLVMNDHAPDLSKNFLLKLLRRYLPIADQIHGEKFFIKQTDPATGKMVKYVTPLFVALLMIEFVDLIFAVDSIPAIFAITTDPYLVYTSNIFAILGLRALYFAMAAMIHRFKYLKQALAFVLIFIGSKIFIADLMGWNKFPASLSLGITLGLIACGIVYSLFRTRQSRSCSV